MTKLSGAFCLVVLAGTLVFNTQDASSAETSANLTVADESADSKQSDVVRVQAYREGDSGPFLPDVKGTKIYSGKKTSNVQLSDLPTNSNNNFRQALVK